MKFTGRIIPLLTLITLLILSGNLYGANSYDREITVKNDTRELAVEEAFKELLAAYEDEDPIGFLDRVSDERFRQDYMTFTDALYTDFREYDIHRVDYWIDRVVSDHIKGFLWVRWEKRYESFDEGRQITTTGYSRFLFDEINGKYLLIELAGNNLFGGSLQEWRDEVPQIVGQEAEVAQGLPDLVIENVVIDDPTTSIRFFTFNVRNIGNARSSDCQVSGDYDYPDTVNALDPNEYQSFSGTYDSTILLPAGPRITVDPSNEVNESNEDNNTAEIL